MTLEELNALRPNDRIVYEVAKTATTGKVLSVWRDSHMMVKWNGEPKPDTLLIDKDTAQHLRKL